MSRGHSGRKGRSRCCSKIGPHARSHKAASVIRRQAIKAGEDVVQPMPLPNLSKGVDPVAHDLPPSVVEPVISVRQFGGRTVPFADFSGAA
jgi:hypothetical protein